MPVVQVVLEMSPEAVLGIAEGTLVRHGGVVYHATGGIFEHLVDGNTPVLANEMPAPVAKASKSIFSSVSNHLKNPKVLVLMGVGLILIGGAVYVIDKNKKLSNHETATKFPKCVVDYNDSIISYLDAINRGDVSLDKINYVIKNINVLRENKEIVIGFTDEKSETLVNFVYNYTIKLAEANSFSLFDIEKSTYISADNTLVDLCRYLEIQKEIFEEAA